MAAGIWKVEVAPCCLHSCIHAADRTWYRDIFLLDGKEQASVATYAALLHCLLGLDNDTLHPAAPCI